MYFAVQFIFRAVSYEGNSRYSYIHIFLVAVVYTLEVFIYPWYFFTTIQFTLYLSVADLGFLKETTSAQQPG